MNLNEFTNKLCRQIGFQNISMLFARTCRRKKTIKFNFPIKFAENLRDTQKSQTYLRQHVMEITCDVNFC